MPTIRKIERAQPANEAPQVAPRRPARQENGGDLGFEATLWAADALRGNLESAGYKHVVLGLIFLKYISDAFEEKRAALAGEPGADPEDRDEYLAEGVFWVPREARWDALQKEAWQPTIGQTAPTKLVALERSGGCFGLALRPREA
jgi:type I restriction enzyme M protein